MNANTRPADQRSKPRVTIPEHPQVVDTHSGAVIGQLVNLSSDGLMLAGSRPIERNCVCQMRIPLMVNGRSTEIKIGAECLWCEDTNGSGTHWSGFQIIDIGSEDQAILDRITEA